MFYKKRKYAKYNAQDYVGCAKKRSGLQRKRPFFIKNAKTPDRRPSLQVVIYVQPAQYQMFRHIKKTRKNELPLGLVNDIKLYK